MSVFDVYEVPYVHTYLTSGFAVGGCKVKKRHGCLKMGDWCWKNLLEYPLDLVDYIRYKLKR